MAERDAMRRSQARAQPRPAPAQAPLTAAMVTSGISWSCTGTWKSSGRSTASLPEPTGYAVKVGARAEGTAGAGQHQDAQLGVVRRLGEGLAGLEQHAVGHAVHALGTVHGERGDRARPCRTRIVSYADGHGRPPVQGSKRGGRRSRNDSTPSFGIGWSSDELHLLVAGRRRPRAASATSRRTPAPSSPPSTGRDTLVGEIGDVGPHLVEQVVVGHDAVDEPDAVRLLRVDAAGAPQQVEGAVGADAGGAAASS